MSESNMGIDYIDKILDLKNPLKTISFQFS